MTRFAVRSAAAAANRAMVCPAVLRDDCASADFLGHYLESLQILDRLHRWMLDLVRDEFVRLGPGDLTPVQGLLIYNLGDCEVSAGELRTLGMYQGSRLRTRSLIIARR